MRAVLSILLVVVAGCAVDAQPISEALDVREQGQDPVQPSEVEPSAPPTDAAVPASAAIERPRFEPEAEALEVHDGIAEILAAGMELARVAERDASECKQRSRPHIAAARALRARAARLLAPEYVGLREAAGLLAKCVGCKADAAEYCRRMESSLASARGQWQPFEVEDEGSDAP